MDMLGQAKPLETETSVCADACPDICKGICAWRNPGMEYDASPLCRLWFSICTRQETLCELCLAMLMWAPPSAICLISEQDRKNSLSVPDIASNHVKSMTNACLCVQ